MIERILNFFFQRRDIVNCERDIYLRRWFIIRTERLGVFLHKFERSDEDRSLHDHPWAFITFILWRGYLEHFRKHHKCDVHNPCDYLCDRDFWHDATARRWPLTVHCRPATWRHRVELLNGPAWTLVIRFQRKRDWHQILTFNQPLQPQLLLTEKPFQVVKSEWLEKIKSWIPRGKK